MTGTANPLKIVTGLLPLLSISAFAGNAPQKRPNVVFFMAEDISRQTLALYEGHGAQTPFLDQLASHGVVFNNAYSNAPVSSAARSTLITGTYAPARGLSSHRKLEEIALPDDMWLFPHYLREAGWYTSNYAKTDYNCVLDSRAWDEIDAGLTGWRERPDADQPFFHCVTDLTCHESCLHFPASDVHQVPVRHQPSAVELYPFHPDTELFRYTYARLYDKINEVDRLLGEVIAALEADGLMDDTFIIYMGDNGGCFPFTKGYTNEMGLNVPLVVYVPENWKHLVPYSSGERTDAFVSFMDLGPTVLHLAGVEVPEKMDGRAFLGKGIRRRALERRDEVYCYGDRYDELYAINRTVRKGNLKYSRNMLPWQPKGLYTFYRYKQEAFKEWARLYEAGVLNEVQSAFFKPQGVEELYDLSADPFETRNLAADPAHASDLAKMRRLLQKNILGHQDLVMIPEPFWISHVKSMETWREKVAPQLETYFSAMQLQIGDFARHKADIAAALAAEDPILRYWGVSACCAHGASAAGLDVQVRHLLEDENTTVRSRAALFCRMRGQDLPAGFWQKVLADSENEAATLMTLNDMAWLYATCPGFRTGIDAEDLKWHPTFYEERLLWFSKFEDKD